MFQGEPNVDKPKSAAKSNKSRKTKVKSLKVTTNVKAGGLNVGNRCETLRRKV
jgi:hypothetical protein